MDKLGFIDKQMTILSVPYEFGEWTQDSQYPYSVGELLNPEDVDTENGKETSTLIITVFHRGKKIALEEIKEKIKKHFYHGVREMIDNNAIVVSWGGAMYIPSGEAELQKLQINLNITEWKVYI